MHLLYRTSLITSCLQHNAVFTNRECSSNSFSTKCKQTFFAMIVFLQMTVYIHTWLITVTTANTQYRFLHDNRV